MSQRVKARRNRRRLKPEVGSWRRVASDVKLGANVKIADFVNLYGCEIGDGSQIGPFVEVQRGARIGGGVKVQSHAFICEGVTLEDDVFIGHGVMFVNDRYPRAQLAIGDPPFVPQQTLVKRGASIGSNATVLGDLVIGEGAIVGAGAVVTRDVPDWTIVTGPPGRVLRTIDRVTKTGRR